MFYQTLFNDKKRFFLFNFLQQTDLWSKELHQEVVAIILILISIWLHSIMFSFDELRKRIQEVKYNVLSIYLYL